MAKVWLCRDKTIFNDIYVYRLFIGRKPKKLKKNEYDLLKWPEIEDHQFCSETFEHNTGRSLKLKPGEGPIEVEIFPRKRGRNLVAMRDKECVELFNSDGFTIWTFDLKEWRRMAPRGLVPKEGQEVKFWVRKAKK